MTGTRVTRSLILSGSAGVVALIIFVIIEAATRAASAGSIAIGAVQVGLFTFVVAFILNFTITSIYARRRS